MSLATFAEVFGLIFLLELPDKTMIANIVMSARARPLLVFIGASGAFVVQMAIAAVAGGLLGRLPHVPKEIVVAILFLGGAAYLLLVPEKVEQTEGDAEGAAVTHAPAWRVILTAFSVIFVAEFGDLSQIQAANFVAKTQEPLLVFLAASSALICVSALGCFAGGTLVRYVPLAKVRLAGGVIFAALGIYTVISLFVS